MKVVAVSQRVDVFADRGESRDTLDQRLITFLLAAGRGSRMKSLAGPPRWWPDFDRQKRR